MIGFLWPLFGGAALTADVRTRRRCIGRSAPKFTGDGVDLCGGETALFLLAAGREHEDGGEKSQKEGLADDIARPARRDRKSTRLNSSHLGISYAVFCLKKKKKHRYTHLV